MIGIENNYTMPLLFGGCWKQGHCCPSTIGVVTVPATTVMQSSDWCSQWYSSAQVIINEK